MIVLKTQSELHAMLRPCRISADALNVAEELIRPGITTKEIDKAMHDYIVRCGAKPSFLGLYGFPASACISVNDVVIHGIPDGYRLVHGDIVSIDVGAYCDGFHGDNAYTFIVGDTSEENKKLLQETEAALYKGIEQAVVGNRIGDISHAIETHVSQFGYGIVRKFVGHGVGKALHEDPEVPNFGRAGHGPRLVEGMTIAIEPMITLKGDGVRVMPDGWTTKTVTGAAAAHFEHTIAITSNGPQILTKRK
ncbi:MAG: type I methionyl aminopeptidase [Oscillospiraceae bacterium]|nr:type I methionyl aminopeptidase [Oscillospiraceae bacterium]